MPVYAEVKKQAKVMNCLFVANVVSVQRRIGINIVWNNWVVPWYKCSYYDASDFESRRSGSSPELVSIRLDHSQGL